MTNLSPAAQAVLDAAMQYEINPECYSREIAAAALRAAADQVVPETKKPARDEHNLSVWQWMVDCWSVNQDTRAKFLAIAAELEAQ